MSKFMDDYAAKAEFITGRPYPPTGDAALNEDGVSTEMRRLDLMLRYDIDCWTFELRVDDEYYAGGYAPTFDGIRTMADVYVVNLRPETV